MGTKKITLRQYILLFIMSTFSPSIRIFPSMLSKSANVSAWLVPLVACVVFIAFLSIIPLLFKHEHDTNLNDVFERTFGRIITKGIMTVYFVWIVILTSMYVSYYAERLLSSIIPECSKEFLILMILVIVYFVARGGLTSLARFNEALFPLFLFILLAVTALLLIDVDVNNLYPVTLKEIDPILRSTHIVIAPWGYIMFILFFAHEVDSIENLKKVGIKATLLLTVTAVLILIATIGSLGAQLTSRTTLPFFIAVKGISILDSFNRLESIVISIWIIADFLIISLFAYTGLCVLKSLFNLPEKKYFASPFIILVFILSLYLARNSFELQAFSEKIVMPVNITLCYCVPLILLVIGKIRKKI